MTGCFAALAMTGCFAALAMTVRNDARTE